MTMPVETETVARSGPSQELLFGHPKGLYVLFLTEMWERFSYYGMRVLLILYLVDHFKFADSDAVMLYGSFTALIFILPVFGGWVADRFLGFRKAVMFGAILMALGHFGMVFEGTQTVMELQANGELLVIRDNHSLQVLYLSLSFLICGVGFLKPNITSIVGLLYPNSNHQRDSGFTIFSMGIMLGAALAPFACGYLGQTFGWGYGFGLAGIGMLIGLFVFIYGQRYLHGIAEAPDTPSLQTKKYFGLKIEHVIYLSTLLIIVLIWQTVQNARLVEYLLGTNAIGVLVGIIAFAFIRLERKERDRTVAALLVFALTAVYAVFIEQYGSSLLLFADRAVDRSFFGFQLQSSQLVGILPVCLVILSPVYVWLWGFLDRHDVNPGTFYKFGVAFLLLALAFAFAWLGTLSPNANGQVGLVWLGMLFFLMAVSDLWIIPIGMSMVSKLSNKTMIGLMMGAYMLALSAGYYISAIVAQYSLSDRDATSEEILSQYQHFFAYLTVSTVAIGIVTLLLAPFVRKYLHGVK